VEDLRLARLLKVRVKIILRLGPKLHLLYV
jgi:hypothetical protein